MMTMTSSNNVMKFDAFYDLQRMIGRARIFRQSLTRATFDSDYLWLALGDFIEECHALQMSLLRPWE